MPLPLHGPRDLPAGRAEQLVVLCHGFGTNGADIIELAPVWRNLLPNAAFVAPDGPEDRGGKIVGFRWFAVPDFIPEEMLKSAAAAAPVLERFIDDELKRLDLSPDRLALVGFSQGSMMVMQVGLRRRIAPRAIIGWCGPLLATVGLPERPAPQVLLIAGDADPRIPVNATLDAATRLKAAGVPVRTYIGRGVGHTTVDAATRQMAGEFLRDAFT